jgi:hypothetical protein
VQRTVRLGLASSRQFARWLVDAPKNPFPHANMDVYAD